MRLLIVEDNQRLSEWLARLLRGENYVVECIPDGESVIDGVALENYDLAIVDLGLPGVGGIDVVRHIRANHATIPVLILTAEDALKWRVEGLDAGADDYMTKPFEVEELEARIRALARRSSRLVREELRYGPLSFDQNTRQFAIGDRALQLSPREHAVLEALMRRAGATVSKEVLLEASYGFDEEVNLSVIEVTVHRLRRKLESDAISIATLRGLGYVLRLAQP